MAKKIGCYTVKSYDNYLYTWCPEQPVYNKIKGKFGAKQIVKNYCNATPGSQGEDWITTYVYNLIISQNGESIQRSAYVECDYVQ